MDIYNYKNIHQNKEKIDDINKQIDNLINTLTITLNNTRNYRYVYNKADNEKQSLIAVKTDLEKYSDAMNEIAIGNLDPDSSSEDMIAKEADNEAIRVDVTVDNNEVVLDIVAQQMQEEIKGKTLIGQFPTDFARKGALDLSWGFYDIKAGKTLYKVITPYDYANECLIILEGCGIYKHDIERLNQLLFKQRSADEEQEYIAIIEKYEDIKVAPDTFEYLLYNEVHSTIESFGINLTYSNKFKTEYTISKSKIIPELVEADIVIEEGKAYPLELLTDDDYIWPDNFDSALYDDPKTMGIILNNHVILYNESVFFEGLKEQSKTHAWLLGFIPLKTPDISNKEYLYLKYGAALSIGDNFIGGWKPVGIELSEEVILNNLNEEYREVYLEAKDTDDNYAIEYLVSLAQTSYIVNLILKDNITKEEEEILIRSVNNAQNATALMVRELIYNKEFNPQNIELLTEMKPIVEELKFENPDVINGILFKKNRTAEEELILATSFSKVEGCELISALDLENYAYSQTNAEITFDYENDKVIITKKEYADFSSWFKENKMGEASANIVTRTYDIDFFRKQYQVGNDNVSGIIELLEAYDSAGGKKALKDLKRQEEIDLSDMLGVYGAELTRITGFSESELEQMFSSYANEYYNKEGNISLADVAMSLTLIANDNKLNVSDTLKDDINNQAIYINVVKTDKSSLIGSMFSDKLIASLKLTEGVFKFVESIFDAVAIIFLSDNKLSEKYNKYYMDFGAYYGIPSGNSPFKLKDDVDGMDSKELIEICESFLFEECFDANKTLGKNEYGYDENLTYREVLEQLFGKDRTETEELLFRSLLTKDEDLTMVDIEKIILFSMYEVDPGFNQRLAEGMQVKPTVNIDDPIRAEEYQEKLGNIVENKVGQAYENLIYNQVLPSGETFGEYLDRNSQTGGKEGFLGQLLYGVGTQAIPVALRIAATACGVPALGFLSSFSFAINCFGSSSEEAIAMGSTDKAQILSYALLNTAVELLVERFSPGDMVFEKTLINSKNLTGLTKILVNSLGEGVEEDASYLLSPLVMYITGMDEFKEFEGYTKEEACETFLMGMLSSMIIQSATGPIYNKIEEKNAYKMTLEYEDIVNPTITKEEYEEAKNAWNDTPVELRKKILEQNEKINSAMSLIDGESSEEPGINELQDAVKEALNNKGSNLAEIYHNLPQESKTLISFESFKSIVVAEYDKQNEQIKQQEQSTKTVKAISEFVDKIKSTFGKINKMLYSNYKYLSSRIDHDQNVYIYFDEKALGSEQYYDLFKKYFKRWPRNYKIISEHKELLTGLNLEEIFGRDFSRYYLFDLFENYTDVPLFIKEGNLSLLSKFLDSKDCFKLYSEFIKYVNKGVVDEKFINKSLSDISMLLENHLYVKDFIIDILMKQKGAKQAVYAFLLENREAYDLNHYKYMLDDEFYKKYYELEPDKFDGDTAHIDIKNLDESNFLNYYLQKEDADVSILDYMYNYVSLENRTKISEKINELRTLKFQRDFNAEILKLANDMDYIRFIPDYYLTLASREQLIQVANIMANYTYPTAIEKLWKNEYYVRALMENNRLDDLMYKKFIFDYSLETRVELYNYFKNKNDKGMVDFFYRDNYCIDMYHLLLDKPLKFSANSEALDVFLQMKEKNVKNLIEISSAKNNDKVLFILMASKYLPGQVVNLQEDMKIKFEYNNQEYILEALKQLSESDFANSVILYWSPFGNDVMPADFLKKCNDILPGRIKISNGIEYTIQHAISVDQTLDYYVNSVSDYVDKNNNLKSLSPYEKYVALYTIVTNYNKYVKEKDGEHPVKSRSLYSIINSDDQRIVCVGYGNFLRELLKRAGINCTSIGHGSNHDRTVVRIDDDKYNIHASFVCDPTWDSRTTNDLVNSSGTYSYVHLSFDRVTEKDKVPKDGLFSINKDDLDNSLSSEKLVVALANIQRFVDKEQDLLSGVEVGVDITFDEYNDIAEKYGFELKLPPELRDKCFNLPYNEVYVTLNDSQFRSFMDFTEYNKFLKNYGISISISFNGLVYINVLNDGDSDNRYWDYLKSYITPFNFYNELHVDPNMSFNQLQPIIMEYAKKVVEGIPSEYYERYVEKNTIDIPFGNKDEETRINSINFIIPFLEESYSFIDSLYGLDFDEEVQKGIINYCLNFSTDMDFDDFTKMMDNINSDWRDLPFWQIKQVALDYINNNNDNNQ